VLAYTGDTGPTADVVELARGAELLLAEASFVAEVPPAAQRHLSSARDAGRQAAAAGVGRLVLTHLLPGTDAAAAQDAARTATGPAYGGDIDVAVPDLEFDLS
jgi:ribonuclease BN (tRNA processing enzyme)